MSSLLLVISDLHLGGETDGAMCSATGHAALSKFLVYVRKAKAEAKTKAVRLVIAGDVVDFLAEKDARGGWTPFAAKTEEALRRFRAIRRRTQAFWDGLRSAAEAGVEIIFLLGNHDVELSFPAVKRELLSSVGGRQVSIIDDNQAFRCGPVLVEHGNRYDPWNAVPHDALRRIRSQLSREEPADDYPVQPGSVLVAKVMNPIKESYGFVDLLKPETAAVLPILASLGPAVWMKAWPSIYLMARAAWRGRGYDDVGRPRRKDLIAAGVSRPQLDDATEEQRIAETVRAGKVPKDDYPEARAFEEALEAARSASVSSDRVSRVAPSKLLAALRFLASRDDVTWDVAREVDTYLKPAREMAKRGIRVVVFGHTHLAKRVDLGGGAVYLNTGTWADLIRVPESILAAVDGEAEAEAEAAKRLGKYVAQLRGNDLSVLRRLVPTFARIELDDEEKEVQSANVLMFDGTSSPLPVSTQSVAGRFA